MNKGKSEGSYIIEREGTHMAVSMAVVPTLKGEAAESIIRTLGETKIKPYSQDAKDEAEKTLSVILQKRDDK